MQTSRFLVAALTLACASAACDVGDDTPGAVARRHQRDARAAVDSALVADASISTGGGDIACYTEGEPGATCSAPAHCCFTNYSSQHDGYCAATACAYGTITCDGPEDCATGQRCCAHAIRDPDYGTTGYTIGCQAACGADVELCHPASGCSTGAACVGAYGHDNDLPRALYICQ